VFSPDLVRAWIGSLRAQVFEIAKRPHPYEFDLYLDV